MLTSKEIEVLLSGTKVLAEAELIPVQGDRFQPTGFADLGAAIYSRPDGKRMVLLETAQSMANRMEKVCLDGDGPHMRKELHGIPYVIVKMKGDSTAETSSLIEAHRLNSPFIISNQTFKDKFVKMANYGESKSLDWRAIGRTLFYFDPNSLVHGVFMANLEDGRIKTPRALTAFIEGEDVMEVASGGVKNNQIDPSGKLRAKDYDKNVYGNVPYHRMEYTASKIKVYFNLDVSLIKGYQLDKSAEDLLMLLSLYKIRMFLNSGLRLRTACDLITKNDIKMTLPTGLVLPNEAELLSGIRGSIDECKKKNLFNPENEWTIEVDVVKKKEKSSEGQ
jgi:CRISPR-associated protein Csb1